jgi:hypothetical protein
MKDPDTTAPFVKAIPGNDVFSHAFDAVGCDNTLATLLCETLHLIGSSPEEMTIQDLATVLPELERRLHMAVPFEPARRNIARLRALILDWRD